MGEIVKFPNNQELALAKNITQKIVSILHLYDYTVYEDSPLFNDLSVIHNMIYAMICRENGMKHEWHEMIDEINSLHSKQPLL